MLQLDRPAMLTDTSKARQSCEQKRMFYLEVLVCDHQKTLATLGKINLCMYIDDRLVHRIREAEDANLESQEPALTDVAQWFEC